MEHNRNEFVQNAGKRNTESGLAPLGTPYDTYYNANTIGNTNGNARGTQYDGGHGYYRRTDQNYTFQPNQSQNELLRPNRQQSRTGLELHELANFSAYPSNPFSGSEEAQNPFDPERQPRFHELNARQTHEGDSSPFSDESSDKEDVQRRMRENERNRRKLATRLPHYHVTKLPYFSILVTIAQVAVFIVELVRMANLTGSPFQSQPYFNPMLGPSTYLLVNMGARYVPCMHPIANITLDMSIQFTCPNSTTVDSNVCNLSQLCGMGGLPVVNNTFVPDQRIRIFTPIFLHAGFLHIIFNMMLQLAMGMAVERHVGFIKYGLIYMCSGVAGFLLGANFAPNGIASTGASGSLFGIIAANLILFIYCGRKNTNIYFTKKYTLFILLMVGEIIVSFVLGLLPGLDNFSHIGGFCMGLLMSIALLQDPSFVYIDGIYTYDATTTTMKTFISNWNPLNKIQDKVRWKFLVWSVVRLICTVLVVLYFVLLVQNLYSPAMESDQPKCTWCKYINCIPVHNWCETGQVTVTSSSTPSTPTTNAFNSASSITPLPLPTQGITRRGLADYSTTPRAIGEVNPYIHSSQTHQGTFVLCGMLAFLSFTTFRRLKLHQREKPEF